jgi:hypothetical protein
VYCWLGAVQSGWSNTARAVQTAHSLSLDPRRWHHSANRKCLDVDAARDARGGPKAAAATVCTKCPVIVIALVRGWFRRIFETDVAFADPSGSTPAPRTVRCLSDSRPAHVTCVNVRTDASGDQCIWRA